VAVWSVTFVAGIIHLSYLTTLPPRVPAWPDDPTRPAEKAPKIDDEIYDAIQEKMYWFQVSEILGGSHTVVDDPTWPRSLRGNEVVWWKWTSAASPDRWIAVALTRDWRGDPGVVVAKRKSGF